MVLMRLSMCVSWLKIFKCWRSIISVWDYVGNIIKEGSDGEPVYDDKYVKNQSKILWW